TVDLDVAVVAVTDHGVRRRDRRRDAGPDHAGAAAALDRAGADRGVVGDRQDLRRLDLPRRLGRRDGLALGVPQALLVGGVVAVTRVRRRSRLLLLHLPDHDVAVVAVAPDRVRRRDRRDDAGHVRGGAATGLNRGGDQRAVVQRRDQRAPALVLDEDVGAAAVADHRVRAGDRGGQATAGHHRATAVLNGER